MRVLLLHGWAQSGDVFRRRLGPLRRKAAQRGIELIWPDAPHELPPSVFGARPGALGWFFPEMPPGSPEGASLRASGIRYRGLEAALEVIEAAPLPDADGEAGPAGAPVDAWVCFSQGAVLAHHVIQCGLAHRLGHPVHDCGLGTAEGAGAAAFAARCDRVLPRGVVLVCGFPSRALSPWPAGEAVTFPCMHVTSPDDTTVPEALQLELRDRFAASRTAHLSHSHGHAMVQRAADVGALLDWLEGLPGADECRG